MNRDVKIIVNGLVNNAFCDSVCLVCLIELDEGRESIFTKVGKDDMVYCVADVLNTVFDMQFSENDEYNVCPNCFIGALSMYKFYLQVKRSQEILNFYTETLTEQIDDLQQKSVKFEHLISIEVPYFEPQNKELDIDIGAFASQYVFNKKGTDNIIGSDVNINNYNLICDGNDIVMNEEETTNDINANFDQVNHLNIFDESILKKETYNEDSDKQVKELKTDSNDTIIVVKDNYESKFYEINTNGELILIDKFKEKDCDESNVATTNKKQKQIRKRRMPMDYISCTECPIKYRFASKLITHMKEDHNIDAFICKICKIVFYNQKEYFNHLNSHNRFICGICGIGVKKRSSLISHIKKHDHNHLESSTDAHICEICGQVVPEVDLKEHFSRKHEKKFICFYCGKSYKGETSLESHIKKHESFNQSYKCFYCDETFKLPQLRDDHVSCSHAKEGFKCSKCDAKFDTPLLLKQHEKIHRNFHCESCSKSFVDARALLWHQRLHTGERPYECKTCGRTFITANRRNQHAVCAHSDPTRRCPLCPALFHLRSMVNSHIRKVHLKGTNTRPLRWCRTAKHRDVFWRTEVVPLQELSVAVQNELLHLKTDHTDENDEEML